MLPRKQAFGIVLPHCHCLIVLPSELLFCLSASCTSSSCLSTLIASASLFVARRLPWCLLVIIPPHLLWFVIPPPHLVGWFDCPPPHLVWFGASFAALLHISQGFGASFALALARLAHDMHLLASNEWSRLMSSNRSSCRALNALAFPHLSVRIASCRSRSLAHLRCSSSCLNSPLSSVILASMMVLCEAISLWALSQPVEPMCRRQRSSCSRLPVTRPWCTIEASSPSSCAGHHGWHQTRTPRPWYSSQQK